MAQEFGQNLGMPLVKTGTSLKQYLNGSGTDVSSPNKFALDGIVVLFKAFL